MQFLWSGPPDIQLSLPYFSCNYVTYSEDMYTCLSCRSLQIEKTYVNLDMTPTNWKKKKMKKNAIIITFFSEIYLQDTQLSTVTKNVCCNEMDYCMCSNHRRHLVFNSEHIHNIMKPPSDILIL